MLMFEVLKKRGPHPTRLNLENRDLEIGLRNSIQRLSIPLLNKLHVFALKDLEFSIHLQESTWYSELKGRNLASLKDWCEIVLELTEQDEACDEPSQVQVCEEEVSVRTLRWKNTAHAAPARGCPRRSVLQENNKNT